MSKQALVKAVIGSSEVKRGLEGYRVLSDSLIDGQRTLVLERPAGAGRKRIVKKKEVASETVSVG